MLRPVIILSFLFLTSGSVFSQFTEELQVTYGDGTRDTFSFVTGNQNRVPWFNLQDAEIGIAMDENDTTLACGPITSDINGKIAILDRGVCLISDKYANITAQNSIGFLMCNGLDGDPPILGSLGPPYLPTGTMWKHDCDSLKLKLDSATRVNWISEYLIDCDDLDATSLVNCDDAIDLGVITNCPDITNSTTITTGNGCLDETQSGACFSDTLGSVWVKWTTGDDMTRVNIQLIGIRGRNPFFEIYDAGDCGSIGPIITCLVGDSIFLIENLNPNTTYYGLLGELEKTVDAGSFIAVRNADCNFKIKGNAYHDENLNGVLDPGEDTLGHIAFEYKSDGRRFYSENDGTYETLIGLGLDTIMVSPEDECWTIADSSYWVFSSLDGDMQMVDLPLVPTSSMAVGSELSISAARLRCNSEVVVWVTIENTGCQDLNDEFELVLDSLLGMVNGEDTVRFTVTDLLASGTQRFEYIISMPDETFLGDTIRLEAIFNGETIVFEDVLSCAYDPNDKQVSPYRDFPENYTLFSEKLVYTVRFQNTGTDTAYDVRIDDTLSKFLDWSMVDFISSSHDGRFSITSDGVISMLFENIFLVDSFTNEPLSNGFFKFSVAALPGLEEFTTIQNTAAIYFDRNAPIITNTVASVMVSSFDFDEDDSPFWEDCDDSNALINPEAEEIVNNGIDENCDGMDLTSSTEEERLTSIDLYPNPFNSHFTVDMKNEIGFIELLNSQGQKLKSYSSATGKTVFSMDNESSGVYFVLVHLENGEQKVLKVLKF